MRVPEFEWSKKARQIINFYEKLLTQMNHTTLSTENTPLVLQISPALAMTDEQFFGYGIL